MVLKGGSSCRNPRATGYFAMPLDGATAHTAKMVQAWCKDNFKSLWSKELWPPSSPDLNLMDFGIWSILERKACTVSLKCGKIEKEIERILGENRK